MHFPISCSTLFRFPFNLLPRSDGANGVVIKAGEHNLGKTESSEQKIQVEKAFVHPAYNRENDICLLKLKSELNFDDYTQPACVAELSTR